MSLCLESNALAILRLTNAPFPYPSATYVSYEGVQLLHQGCEDPDRLGEADLHKCVTATCVLPHSNDRD